MRGWFFQVLLVGVSILLHTLAMPPCYLWPLAWVALVSFFLALANSSVRRGALLGLLWGTGAIWGVGHWVPSALSFYYQQSQGFGWAFSLVASVAFAGVYSAGFAAAWCFSRAGFSERVRPWLAGVLWVAWELARARLFTGEPWLLLGYALAPSTTMPQAADLGGVPLLSFGLAASNASLVEAISLYRVNGRAAARALAVAAAIPLASVAYGGMRLQASLPSEPRLQIAVVQGNIDASAQWREEHYGKGLDQYLRLSQESATQAPPDLFVWPESALNFFLPDEPTYQRAIADLLAHTGADLIVGGPRCEACDSDVARFFNSVFYVDRSGTITGYYDKVHLLPFAEYFPLKTVEFLDRQFDRVRWFTPGTDAVLLNTRVGPVATVVCFEAIFPELVREQMRRGATLLFNLSNDVWLGSGAGPEQHLAMVRLRAIEHRTWVVRATTTGITALIDPFGRVVQRAPADQAATLLGHVVPARVGTVYQNVGDLFAYVAVALSLGAVGATAGTKRPTSRGR